MSQTRPEFLEHCARRAFGQLFLTHPDSGEKIPLSHIWRVSGLLGYGGESTVLHLTPLYMSGLPIKEVALKVLKPEVSCDEFHRNRLVREGQLLYRCRGRCLVELYGIVYSSDNEPALLLELVDSCGKSLHSVVSRHMPFSLQQRLTWFEMCLQGVSQLHARGVAHRDIKGGNFCITPNGGNIKLLDLTQAELETGKPVNSLRGSAYYWPPDYLERGVRMFHHDLFALCLLLSELLLERLHPVPLPAGCTSQQMDAAIQQSIEIALHCLHVDLEYSVVPRPLVRLIQAGTALRQPQRFQTIEALMVAFDAAVSAL